MAYSRSSKVSTWIYTASEEHAPENFIFLSKLLTYGSPCDGFFSTGQPFPPAWTEGLRPAVLSQVWCSQFLRTPSDASGALTWTKRQHQRNASRYSIRDIGDQFFEKDVFKRFTDCKAWTANVILTGSVRSDSFTPMHLLLLLDGFDTPCFPSQGLTRDEFENFLRTVSWFFELACISNSMDDYSLRDPFFASSPLQQGLYQLLQLLDLRWIWQGWIQHQQKLTVAFYQALEELFELILSWMSMHEGHRAAAEASITGSVRGQTAVVLNPASQQSADGSMLLMHSPNGGEGRSFDSA